MKGKWLQAVTILFPLLVLGLMMFLSPVTVQADDPCIGRCRAGNDASACLAGETMVDIGDCLPGSFVCCAVLTPTPIPCDYETVIDPDTGATITVKVNPLLRPWCALNETQNLVSFIVSMATVAAGVLALIFLLLGGFYYAWSMDNPELQERARGTIQWAFLGALFAASAFLIMRVIANTYNIPGFGFDLVERAYAQAEQVTYQVSGKVYDAQRGTVLPGSEVTIYVQGAEGWQLWPAQGVGQRNPFITDSFGQYQFFVEAGSYYVEVQKEGYFSQQSEVLLIGDGPVAQDFQLERAPRVWIFLLMIGGVVLIGTITYMAISSLLRWQKKTELKSMIQREIEAEETVVNRPAGSEQTQKANSTAE